MGQKSSPIGFRLAVRRDWRSLWFANKKEFKGLIGADMALRKHMKKVAPQQGTSGFEIKREADRILVIVKTARPGLIIGKKGADIEVLREQLKRVTGRDAWIEVQEIKRPDTDAQLVADSIARQLERRLPFRRVLKKAMQQTMDAGMVGIKVEINGRVAGAEIARTEWYKQGRVPLQTLRADIRYATARAETTYGSIGVKVWINHGELAVEKQA